MFRQVALFAFSIALMLNANAHSDPAVFGGNEVVPVEHHDHDHAHEELPLYPATIVVDPRQIVNVVVKINARLRNVRNLYAGQRVLRGQVLGELESAELETVQRTYLGLFTNLEAVEAFSMTTNEKLIDARMNLAWRGMSEEDIKRLEETKEPIKLIVLKAPVSGYLYTLSMVNDQIVNAGGQGGQYTTSGTTVATIAKPEAISVEAQVPLKDARDLRPGTHAQVLLPAPGETAVKVHATVERVFGYVSPITQRRRIRLKVSQPPASLPLVEGLPVMVQFTDGKHAR